MCVWVEGGFKFKSLHLDLCFCVSLPPVCWLERTDEMQVHVDAVVSPSHWYWHVIAFFFSIMQFVAIQPRLYFWHFVFYCHIKQIRVHSRKSHLIQVGFVSRQAGHLQRVSGPWGCLKLVVAMCWLNVSCGWGKAEVSVSWCCFFSWRTNAGKLLRLQVDV